MEYQRKTMKIKIEGNEVVLSARDADDVYALIKYVKDQSKKKLPEDQLLANSFYVNAMMIADSMKWWIGRKSFFTRWKYKRKYRASKLIKTLPPELINSIAEAIDIELENGTPIDEKKK